MFSIPSSFLSFVISFLHLSFNFLPAGSFGHDKRMSPLNVFTRCPEAFIKDCRVRLPSVVFVINYIIMITERRSKNEQIFSRAVFSFWRVLKLIPMSTCFPRSSLEKTPIFYYLFWNGAIYPGFYLVPQEKLWLNLEKSYCLDLKPFPQALFTAI